MVRLWGLDRMCFHKEHSCMIKLDRRLGVTLHLPLTVPTTRCAEVRINCGYSICQDFKVVTSTQALHFSSLELDNTYHSTRLSL